MHTHTYTCMHAHTHTETHTHTHSHTHIHTLTLTPGTALCVCQMMESYLGLFITTYAQKWKKHTQGLYSKLLYKLEINIKACYQQTCRNIQLASLIINVFVVIWAQHQHWSIWGFGFLGVFSPLSILCVLSEFIKQIVRKWIVWTLPYLMCRLCLLC